MDVHRGRAVELLDDGELLAHAEPAELDLDLRPRHRHRYPHMN
jgi:hypothetical protein